MKDKTKLKVWGITMLAGLETVALATGLDGSLFGLVVAGIAGLAGYELGKRKD